MHARRDRGAVKLLTRTGLDWTHKYPAIGKRKTPAGEAGVFRSNDRVGGLSIVPEY